MAGDTGRVTQSAKRKAKSEKRKGIILSFAQRIAMPDGEFYFAAWAQEWEIKVQQHEKIAEIIKVYLVATSEFSVAVDPGMVIAQVDAEKPESNKIYCVKPKSTAESAKNTEIKND